MLHRHPLLSVLTGGYLAFVAWLTLTPQVDAVGRISVIYRVLGALHRRGYLLSIDDNQLEFLANIALFVPVGVFLLLLFGTRLWWVALTASFAMTTFIEIAQRSIPGRVPDERDLVANGLGAVIGVLVALVLICRGVLSRGVVRRRRGWLSWRRLVVLAGVPVIASSGSGDARGQADMRGLVTAGPRSGWSAPLGV